MNDGPLRGFGSAIEANGWWLKFSIDVRHDLAWHAVQLFGYVLNYLSLTDRPPTVFMPVSPPPYLNGGPEEYLSWVIECPLETSPAEVAALLQHRLPNPVEDIMRWRTE
jgi:hypothetical protein